MKHLWMISSMIMVLVGCQALGGSPQGSGDGNNSNPITQSGVVRWDRDPLAVVFRADIVGGDDQDALYRLNEVPLCTLYGDGRLVYTLESSDGILPQVIFDFLTDQEIINFVTGLTVESRLFTFEAGEGLEVPSSSEPVVETITLNVNDVEHTVDAFSDWPEEYFNDVIESCQAQANEPAVFEPTAGWIRVESIEYRTDTPSVFWEAGAGGLDFSTIVNAEETRWIEGENVAIIWNQIRNNGLDMQFTDDLGTYQVALQIPGVTRDAPATP